MLINSTNCQESNLHFNVSFITTDHRRIRPTAKAMGTKNHLQVLVSNKLFHMQQRFILELHYCIIWWIQLAITQYVNILILKIVVFFLLLFIFLFFYFFKIYLFFFLKMVTANMIFHRSEAIFAAWQRCMVVHRWTLTFKSKSHPNGISKLPIPNFFCPLLFLLEMWTLDWSVLKHHLSSVFTVYRNAFWTNFLTCQLFRQSKLCKLCLML